MALSTNLELLNGKTTDGCVATGLHREVIQDLGATRTLLPEESGALVLLDKADGIVITLPTPKEGMQFEFLVTVSLTSNAYTVTTAATASEFLIGGVIMGDVTVAQSGDYFEANGSTHVKISSNGSTTGGLLGERFTVTAISATQWAIHGVCHGAGTLADPFATA